MPFGLVASLGAPAVGGILSGLGAIGGSIFGNLSRNRARNHVNNYQRANIDRSINQRYENEIDNFDVRTDRQFNRFRELANQSTPGLQAFIGSSAASGGTGALAALRQRSFQQNNQSNAYNAFGNYQLGRENQRYGLLNQLSNRDLQQSQQDLQARQIGLARNQYARESPRFDPFASAFGALANEGASLAGRGLRQHFFGGRNSRLSNFQSNLLSQLLPSVNPQPLNNFGINDDFDPSSLTLRLRSR